jgi:hypothetical protein
MISATLYEATPLTILAADGRNDLYGRVQLYNANGTLIQVIPVAHVADGLYSVLWTPQSEGYYTVISQFFYDPNYTVPANYERTGELIEVSTTKTNILRIMGLHHENSVLDQQQYDADGNMLQARLRCYDTKANATLGGNTGIRFIYTISASYTNGALTRYMVTREQ